ncbi:hypothetical protein N7540_005117 [Penicillium herquei]|nr:hypothetical protein N7540_005117 [Penicillium herquei]
MASSLNFTTRQLDVQLDPQAFQVNLDHFQESIKSGLKIMFSTDSIALHLNAPLEAQTRAQRLKAKFFQGRDPIVEESSGTDRKSPPSMITWMQLIQEVPADTFRLDSTSNFMYSCHYKGKTVKVLDEDKQKIEDLQEVFGEQHTYRQDIVKEEEVATEMLTRVENVAETFQKITRALDELKYQLGGRIRLCQNGHLGGDTTGSTGNESPRSSGSNSTRNDSKGESTRTLRKRLRSVEASDERISIPSPRKRLPSIEVSNEENCIPRTAEELARGDEFLASARDADKPWPTVANEYAETFRVRRSSNSLSRLLNIYKASLPSASQPQARSEIPVSTNKNSIPLMSREKKEGGLFVDSALRAGNNWPKICDDYSVEFGVWRWKSVLGGLRNRYLKTIAGSDFDGSNSKSSQMISDGSSASLLTGVSRTVPDSEEGTRWFEMQDHSDDDSDDWADVHEEEDAQMADISIRHPV